MDTVEIAAGVGVVSGLLQNPPGARACYVFAHGAGAGMTHPFMAAVLAGLFERGVGTQAVETKRDGKPGEQTEYALRGVSWFALFAKDFTKALAVANRAHALFPDDLGIESNRAHALMFLGYDEEAKALYLAHKGEPVSKADNLLWQQAIAEDFAKLRKAGLMRPMMAEVEKELGVSR